MLYMLTLKMMCIQANIHTPYCNKIRFLQILISAIFNARPQTYTLLLFPFENIISLKLLINR